MRKYFGFSILTFFTLVLFVSTLINLFSIHFLLAVAFMVVIFFALVTIILELRRTRTINKAYNFLSRHSALDFIATFIGAIVTYLLSVYLGVGPVLGSGIIGMLAVIFVKPYAVPAFCGSFLGMSSPELMDPMLFFGASIVVSSIFVICKDVFNGYGGKLGTMALSSALIVSFITGKTYLDTPIFGNLEMFLIVIFSILGALVTYILNIRFQEGPVMASGFVGLLAGALLPFFFEEIGMTLAIVTFGASFVGMSAQKKMPEETLMIFGGLMFGLIYIFSAPYFGGAGGKLGTIAFSSVLSIYGLRYILTQKVIKNV